MTAPSGFGGFAGAAAEQTPTAQDQQNQQPQTGFNNPQGGQQAPQGFNNPQQGQQPQGGQQAPQGFNNPQQGQQPQGGGFGQNLNTNTPQAGQPDNMAAPSRPDVSVSAGATGFGAATVPSTTFIKVTDLANKLTPGVKDGALVVLRPTGINNKPHFNKPNEWMEESKFDIGLVTTGPKQEMAQYALDFLEGQSSINAFITGSCREALNSNTKWIYGRLFYDIPKDNSSSPPLKLDPSEVTDVEVAQLMCLLVIHDQETKESLGITDPNQIAWVNEKRAALGKPAV